MKSKRIKTFVISALIMAVVVVTVVYVIPMVRHRSQNVSLGRQWAGLLKKHPAFSAKRLGYSVDMNFQYAAPTDDNLKKLRDTYDLETVAGQGSETDRFINLTSWVYQLTGHANEPQIPKELNAFNLIHLAKVEHMLINCYMKTIILNEVFLAMGFFSRQTHLLPHSKEEEESHFITSVYSRTLGKWILMDPDFIFKIRCPQISMFDQASIPNRMYFELIPDGYREELLQESKITKTGKKIVFVNDEGLFWQKPTEQSH
jgi:hypothetical protein